MTIRSFGTKLAVSAFAFMCGLAAFGVDYDINPGDDTPTIQAVDLDGNPRVVGKRPDLGCYECPFGPGLMLLVR